jgi:opacity protein-like surface antigen
MRSLTLAAMTAAALTAGVAHADVTETIDLTYSSGATFDGTIVCTDDFSSVTTVNGILTGYDPSFQGFQGLGVSDPITAVSPLNFNLDPNPFFLQLPDSGGQNWVDIGYSFNSSGITLTTAYNDVNYVDQLVSASLAPHPVPEPGTLTLLVLGLLGLAVIRRRETANASIG